MREFGPQRSRHVSLCEALDQVLNTGVVALGEVTLSVADVDLIYLGLQLVVTSIQSGPERAPASAGPQLEVGTPRRGVRGPSERAPASAGPQLGPDWRPGLTPREEEPAGRAATQTGRLGWSLALPRPEKRPASQAATPAASAALPLALGEQTGGLPSGVSGEKTELIADAMADSNREKNGLGKLVLTLMKMLHELLKRQALRRIEVGALTPVQVERLGVTLMNQAREIERLRKAFGLPEEDLNLDLGPLGKLL